MNRSPHNAGFSLVEILVAMLILSVVLVGLVHGITTALGSGKESERQTVAALFAAGLIEDLRAEGDLVNGETQGTCGDELPSYSWTATIADAGIDGLHQVDVSIQSTRTGQAIYDLRTLLFERPEETSDTRQTPEQRRKERRAATE